MTRKRKQDKKLGDRHYINLSSEAVAYLIEVARQMDWRRGKTGRGETYDWNELLKYIVLALESPETDDVKYKVFHVAQKMRSQDLKQALLEADKKKRGR